MILLVSETPVAGTVSRLSRWISRLSQKPTRALVRRNYANNAFRLPEGAFGCLPNWEGFLSKNVRQARTIVLHNVCDEAFLDLIFRAKERDAEIFYQYHSPPGEAPQFNYDCLFNHQFDAVFAVAQGYGRFIDDAVVVPNVVADFECGWEIPRGQTIFSPHMRTTDFRWSNKFSEADQRNVRQSESQFNGFKLVDTKGVFNRDVITHEEMLFFLQSIGIIIDDINTGLFHQTALEGLKAGCMVVSGADMQSVEEFCTAADCPPPPFVRISNGAPELIDVLRNPGLRREVNSWSGKAREYGSAYLGEERLASCYYKILKSKSAYLQ